MSSAKILHSFQASLRYFSSFGLRPVLALKTSEGAFMSPDDKIVDVLSSNEEVLTSVQSWNLPALSERYQDACINSNTCKVFNNFKPLQFQYFQHC